MESADQPEELTPRQRIAIVSSSSMSTNDALAMADSQFDFAMFKLHGVGALQLTVARIGPLQLKLRGVKTAQNLRELDFDALHLVNTRFCEECIQAYGASQVVKHFLLTASDAVKLAGSTAIHQLGLSTGALLICCAGAPAEAYSVIEQTKPRGGCLQGVSPDILLDTGLRATQLRELGYNNRTLQTQTMASLLQLQKLEF